ncbi:MAG: SWIM zinc finger family protein [Anaerolineales bacterium]
MDSGMIGKIQKAKRYAQERHRFTFESFTVSIAGENNTHRVRYENGKWLCDCDFFQSRNVCTHTMALEELLKDMIPTPPQA